MYDHNQKLNAGCKCKMNLKALAQLPFVIIFKNNNKKKIKDKEINAAQMCFFATWTAEEKDWIY